jgi:hypothetical protein
MSGQVLEHATEDKNPYGWLADLLRLEPEIIRDASRSRGDSLQYRDFDGQLVLNTGIIFWAHSAEGSRMKAPKYQRAEMLTAALQEAVKALEDPIEGLEITNKGVVAWAAGHFVLISYRWDNDYGADGAPLLGSGAWSARYVADCDASFRHSSTETVSFAPWWRRWRRSRTTARN